MYRHQISSRFQSCYNLVIFSAFSFFMAKIGKITIRAKEKSKFFFSTIR